MVAELLKPGESYGTFEVVEVVGQGAFAAVYRVRVPGRPNDCALKLSLHAVNDDDGMRRTLREIAILKFLTNHHVVRVHDSGQGHDGRLYLLMDYLEGLQLDAFHDFDQPMPAAQAVTIIHQACLGLAEAHTHGIVHRDIKPSNIWVEPDGNVRVIDFGLARMWEGDSAMATNVTLGRILVGTPHYAQPEQLETHRLTPAGDVYSLAMVLYELLTGHCPFFPDQGFSAVRDAYHDDPVPWLSAHRSAVVTPLHHYPHCRDIPKSLQDLVLQCLEKIPELRPTDAAVLANQLGSILHYDFGVAVAATLRITHPYGGFEEVLLLPGSHRIGANAQLEIRLPGRGVHGTHAILEWDGLPAMPQVRPLVIDGTVRVNGQPITHRAQLRVDDQIQVGPFRLEFSYPTG